MYVHCTRRARTYQKVKGSVEEKADVLVKLEKKAAQ